MVLQASVQVDGGWSELAILKLLALGSELGAVALNVAASIRELGGCRDHDRKEREKGDVLQKELHDYGWCRVARIELMLC